MKKALIAVLLTAVLCVPASAYSVAIEWYGCTGDKANFELHTVSSVCHNVQGWGVSSDSTWKGSTASICLIDRIKLKVGNRNYGWSGAGVMGGRFSVRCDWDRIEYCSTDASKPCPVEFGD